MKRFMANISDFTNKNRAKLKAVGSAEEQKAIEVLKEVMGEDIDTITSITFDMKIGKFKDVTAPEKSLNKLREAGLLVDLDVI